MIWLILISIGMQLLFGGRATFFMVMMFRALSIILHLPMLKTLLPGNVAMLFKIMIPIVQLDLFDNDYINLIIFFQGTQQPPENQISDQLVELGYENESCILNLHSVLILLGLIVAKLVILGVCYTIVLAAY